MVTSVNCYSSVVIEQHSQHTVHYCTGSCQLLKQGLTCIVAHHSVCAELSVQNANLDHKIPVPENGLTCSRVDKEEIDKLLLDLESFSQKIESTLREPSQKEGEPASLQVSGRQGRQALPLALEPKTKPTDPPSSLSKIMETNGHKMEEDDKALLLRILGSIEDFAQELVEFQTGKGSLSKEREVMQILQETLATPSQSLLAGQESHVGAASRDSVPASIQQAPEVIKVREPNFKYWSASQQFSEN
uniref:Uncharacterized protein n=1 Tax=Corvus moneduloides TaxID=1196302 RepID=A0A8C3E8Z5_CORMO